MIASKGENPIMKKKISLINPMTICILLCAIPLVILTHKIYTPSANDPVGGEFMLEVFMGIGGGIIGLGIWFIGHILFRPNHTSRLLQEQNRILYDNSKINNYSKTDELSKLNELKKSGSISEYEFNKLKNEIINRQ